MLRGLLFGLFVLALAVLAAPFVLTSRAVNEHGILLPGTVYHKSESFSSGYSDWTVSRDVTIQYTLPETGGAGFFTSHPIAAHYDAIRLKQPVQIRYLPRKDLPAALGTDILWQMHALPTAKLAGFQESSRLDAFLTPLMRLFLTILAGVVVLVILWRITQSAFLGWAAALACLPLVACLMLMGFPLPTPAPSAPVRRASGKVVEVGTFDKLFATAHSRGVDASQPMDVVSVLFVPEGKTDPVMAVDVIDQGSLPGLRRDSPVAVQYEAAEPRTAHLEGATRNFPTRNFAGALTAGLAYLVVMGLLLGGAAWLGRGYRKLTARSKS
ncbi:MAG TPA: hypothetical protein VG456_21215 [Candidatus Sulfopaludibacter sp.]|jgi:hypothetical protein|nr:hypothetical protein [Candidatus Sulfopaludibacter sp.]